MKKRKKTPRYTVINGVCHLLKLGGPGKAVTWCGVQPDTAKGDQLFPKRPPEPSFGYCPACFRGEL
jgi:hypothetical protein